MATTINRKPSAIGPAFFTDTFSNTEITIHDMDECGKALVSSADNANERWWVDFSTFPGNLEALPKSSIIAMLRDGRYAQQLQSVSA